MLEDEVFETGQDAGMLEMMENRDKLREESVVWAKVVGLAVGSSKRTREELYGSEPSPSTYSQRSREGDDGECEVEAR